MGVSGGASWAQTQPAPESAPQSSAPPLSPSPSPTAVDTIPAGTVVAIEIDEFLSARKSFEGQQFQLHLAEPIVRDGRVLVPAGAKGLGEVIEAKRPGIGGKPGVLTLAARYVDAGPVRIRLGHFGFSRAGHDEVAASMAVGMAVGLPGLLITGDDVKVNAGTRAYAKLVADVPLPAAPTAAPAGATPTTTQTNGGVP